MRWPGDDVFKNFSKSVSSFQSGPGVLDRPFLETQNEICAVSGYAFLAELRLAKGCHPGVVIGEIFADVALSGEQT